jgi:hypothetical protein
LDYSLRKKLFPRVDAASQLADNDKDIQQKGQSEVAPGGSEDSRAEGDGDDGKKKKKKEKVGFRDRKVKVSHVNIVICISFVIFNMLFRCHLHFMYSNVCHAHFDFLSF